MALPEGGRYFEVLCDGENAGLIYFNPLDPAEKVWEGHFMVLPEGAGMAARYARQAIKRMLETGADRVVGFTPLDNLKALRAAFAAGMKYVTRTNDWHMTEFAR